MTKIREALNKKLLKESKSSTGSHLAPIIKDIDSIMLQDDKDRKENENKFHIRNQKPYDYSHLQKDCKVVRSSKTSMTN